MDKYSKNLVLIIGRLGQDVELVNTSYGISVANLSVATTRSKKVNNEWQDETEWHKCVAFGKTAEYAGNYGTKGRLCSITGHLQTRKWQATDGSNRYTTSIVIDHFQFLDKTDLDSRSQQNTQQASQPAQGGHYASSPDESVHDTKQEVYIPQNEEELPF